LQDLPLRQVYLNIVTDTLRLMNEHHLMHPPLLRAIALYVIVSLNNKVPSIVTCHTCSALAAPPMARLFRLSCERDT
jgi:hypothetical protein